MFPFHPRRIAAVCVMFVSSIAAAQSSGDFSAIVQSANAARQAGNVDEAARDYSHALALRPGWAEGWWDLGTMQYEANQYADAVISLRKLTSLVPKMAAGWDFLGLSEFATKDYASALADLEKARALGGVDDPEIARVSTYHLALLMIRSGDFDHATALLHSTFGQAPPPQVKTALGLALLRVPLLPAEVDPSQDALIQATGDAASTADLPALLTLVQQYPKVPWLHYAYGLALERAGETEAALEQQRLETTISPESPLPWIEVSSLTLRLKHPQQSLDAAKEAVSLDPQSAAARDVLAKALASTRNMQAATLAPPAAGIPQNQPYRDPHMIALYAAHSGTAVAPEDSATWAAAMTAYSSGDYRDAIAALKNWVEQNPSDGTAWAVMGLAEYSLKDYDNARIHLQRGITLGIKGSAQSIQEANYRLALLLIHDGQFSAATSQLAPFAGKAPMPEQTRLALGLTLLHIPTLPDDLDAQQHDVAYAAGSIVELLLASRYTDAFPAFRKLLAEHPATPWLHYAYGDALDSLSQYDEARAQMQAELKLSPKNATPWVRIASIDVRQHLPSDAIQAAENAVNLSPDSAEAHYELGRAWLEQGNAQKAIAELEKADELRSSNPEIHFVLARAYTKANQPEKAAAERAIFMQLKQAANQKGGNDSGQSILKSTSQ